MFWGEVERPSQLSRILKVPDLNLQPDKFIFCGKNARYISEIRKLGIATVFKIDFEFRGDINWMGDVWHWNCCQPYIYIYVW